MEPHVENSTTLASKFQSLSQTPQPARVRYKLAPTGCIADQERTRNGHNPFLQRRFNHARRASRKNSPNHGERVEGAVRKPRGQPIHIAKTREPRIAEFRNIRNRISRENEG